MSSIYQADIGGRPLIIETGRLAAQANGAATIAFGETVVLVTAAMSPQLRDIDFFPLTIDFEERMYAVGKIPGAFMRRESRPSTEAVLAGRVTDRALRPLFPKGFRNEVQIIITVLSADQENDPDVLGTIGASAALSISDIPWDGPVSSVRVGYLNGDFVLNPTFAQIAEGSLDLVVTSTREKVIMVEAGANSIPEAVLLDAIKVAHEANQKVIAVQDQMVAELAKAKIAVSAKELEPAAFEAVAALLEGREDEILSAVKEERQEGMKARFAEVQQHLEGQFDNAQLSMALEAVVKKTLRKSILEKGKRADGRAVDELRPISCDVGILPRTHGTGLFQRGETQVLTVATLGPMSMQQKLDTLSPEDKKRFMHHYNFPPFSVGEVRRLGTGRREIGHGALGERALEPVIPSEEEFPYTIRLVSDVLSSNGSTSQASICGSTLALMDAGVPIKAPVAGVAMGLITSDEGDGYKILTDIAGTEDAFGDMDFKVAGTHEGVTAVQADFKIKGLTMPMIEEILGRARTAREVILGKLNEVIDRPRNELSRYAPRMYRIQIPREKIGVVIGPGGKMVRSIIEETKCTVDVQDDGSIYVGSTNEENARKAIAIIEGLTAEARIGQTYTGRVTRTVDFGAFVEIMPGREGLVRIGELADYHVPSVEDVVQVGDEIQVKVIEIDNLGRINLSRRAVLMGENGEYEEEEPQGEIPSPMTRRTSTLTPMRQPQQRPPRQNGGGGGGGGGFRPRGNRGPGPGRGPGGGGGGGGGPRPPRPMGR